MELLCPFLQGSCIPNNMSVYPGALRMLVIHPRLGLEAPLFRLILRLWISPAKSARVR
jgi:hypothetical protein